MTEWDPNYMENAVCRATGLTVLLPHFRAAQGGDTAHWVIRVPIPGVGTDQRRYIQMFGADSMRELWEKVLYGCGWGPDHKTGQWLQQARYNRATKAWEEIDTLQHNNGEEDAG